MIYMYIYKHMYFKCVYIYIYVYRCIQSVFRHTNTGKP